MNKSDLAEKIANQTNLPKASAEKAITTLVNVITEALAAGDKASIPNFGVFSVSDRAARSGKNPQTGAQIQIPATKTPKFKAGKALKDALN